MDFFAGLSTRSLKSRPMAVTAPVSATLNFARSSSSAAVPPAVFGDGGLALFQGEIIGGEELVEDLNGIVVTGDGLASLIPGKREAGAVPLQFGGIELEGGETGFLSKILSDDLVDGDAVGHVLSGDGITVGSGEPEGAAPVGLIGKAVGAALHHGKVRLVAGERSEAFGEFEVRASFIDVREPGLLGDSEAHTEEDGALGRDA